MAIPNRTTILCPACGASEDVTIGEISIGPDGWVNDASKSSRRSGMGL